ncbi:hypothetical protein BDFB_002875, partial [Asbolus verrucosus]
HNRIHKTFSFDFTYDRPINEKIEGSVSVARWGDIFPYIPNGIYANIIAGVVHPDRCPIPPQLCFQMKNKYVVDIAGMEVCPDNDKLINPIRNLKINRYNRTYKTFSYDFSYDRPIDEKIGGSVSVSRWGDGGWIDIPFIGFQRDICRYTLRFFRNHWISFYKNVGLAHPDRCPVPA